MLLTEKGLPSLPLSLFSSCPCHCLSSCGRPGLVKQWQGQICEPGKRTKNGPEQCKCFTYRLATEWGGEAKELAWSVNTNINQCCPNFPAFTRPPPPSLRPYQQTHTKGNPKSLLFVLVERSVCFASAPGWRWLCRRFASYGQCWLCVTRALLG